MDSLILNPSVWNTPLASQSHPKLALRPWPSVLRGPNFFLVE